MNKKKKKALMKKRIRSRRGSYIMEAAVVLPVIIMVTITSILIVMFFYSQMTERCQLHIALRSEAGLASGQTEYADGNTYAEDAEIYTDKSILGSTVYGKKYLVMEHRGTLEKKGTFTVEGKSHAVDGPSYIRYSHFAKGAADE